ncbi:Small ribosomal subunit biogenesis GTPase RsgA [Bienertia sinuspersici]
MEETWEDVQADLAINGKKTKSKRPPKLKPKRQNKRQSKSLPLEPNVELVISQTTSYSNAPNIENNSIPQITNNVPCFNKKIPRTTAARRGAGADRAVQNQNVILEENQMQIVHPDDMTIVGDGVSSDGYIKNGKKGNVAMDDEVSYNDGENENLDEGEIMEMIQDNYDPYADDFWQEDMDNDESYLKRLYKNGEFYEDVVGSRLSDGKTRAIKSIRNDEHTCHGLDNKNPLVNVEWATEKLMDDIRANNDISGNTLNDYLRQRYGVQKARGIEAALTIVWPKVGRRYCCKHLAKNWKGEFNGPFMYSLFWRACSATSPFTFRKAMETIEKANPLARIWLANLGDQSRWTRHKFDSKICSEENKTNFVESFNATLGVDRCRPILTLLEGVRRMCMARMSTRRRNCADWADNEPCPNILAYGNTINSIPDHEHWPDIDMPSLQPPRLKRGVRRPPRNRRREVDEKQKGKRSTTSR